MNTKKYKQGLVTSLTALSTAMLCQTTATYASDIEIYKAPTTGGASLQLVLDMSSSMVQEVRNKSYGNGDPIKNDFDITCSNGNTSKETETGGYAYTLNQTRSFTNLKSVTRTYIFEGRFCNVKKSSVDGYAAKKKALIQKSCTLVDNATPFYRCPDRLTSLKHSFFDLILGTNNTAALPATASIGFVTFPTEVHQSILPLTDPAKNPANPNDTSWDPRDEKNKHTLLSAIAPLTVADGTHIARKYADGAKLLIEHISTVEQSCAGYGVYFLTDGASYQDNRNTANNTISPYLRSPSEISATCTGRDQGFDSKSSPRSWPCVAAIAGQLQQSAIKNGTNNINTEIKTAIVGFGSDFSFKNSSGNPVKFNSSLTGEAAAALFTDEVQKAAVKAAVAGKGGWYSADNTADVVDSVQEFVKSIKVPIPAITTGTSAIPQDALNTSVIQPYAYFPQFQPTPSETTQAWAGNLKKYKVAGGLLKDKGDTSLFSSAGVLNTANEDLWTQNYATGTTLTATQQQLKILGGLLSRINLKKTDNNFNRKVYTNNGGNVTEVTETYIKTNTATRGYLLGLMGYDVTPTQATTLTNQTDLSTFETSPELRQMGAIMHSTPVLLTQSGSITYADNTLDTTNRDDYILVGTTQGVLHIVKAGTASDVTANNNTAGNEVFAFVPEEMYSSQPTALLNPKNTPEGGMNELFYGVDGQWVAHTEYVYAAGTATTQNPMPEGTFKVYDSDNKMGKQWIYGGLRMGGRSYYALDLTRLTAATNNAPTVKFRINPEQNRVDGFDIPAGDTRYINIGKMGQSWSKPTIANVQWKGKRRLVMFVGGGYDATGGSDGKGYETFNYNQTNGVGAGVYMFDANTGEFLWSTYDAVKTPAVRGQTLIGDGDHLKYSVVSQIKVIDREGDGDVDHLYFGDLGGQVFRIDLDKAHGASDTATNYAQQITRIYNGHRENGYSPRFYEMPTFTVYNGAGGLFAVVSIGSGNRSTPLLGKLVNNQYITENETAETNGFLINDAVYNIYDKVVVTAAPHTATLQTSPAINDLHALTDANRISNPTMATWKEVATATQGADGQTQTNLAKSGWYYTFTSSALLTASDARKSVEKVQGELIAIDNDLYVSTFDADGVGTTEACGAGIYGNSRAHRFCMPYGQCASGDTVGNNTLVLGKGLLGITMGPGAGTGDRRIVTPLNEAGGNQITGTNYVANNRLIPQSWYEKN